MAVELCVAQEGIWFDQNKYEEAEARYQEIVADRHAGLRVEVELGRDVLHTLWFSVSDNLCGCPTCRGRLSSRRPALAGWLVKLRRQRASSSNPLRQPH